MVAAKKISVTFWTPTPDQYAKMQAAALRTAGRHKVTDLDVVASEAVVRMLRKPELSTLSLDELGKQASGYAKKVALEHMTTDSRRTKLGTEGDVGAAVGHVMQVVYPLLEPRLPRRHR